MVQIFSKISLIYIILSINPIIMNLEHITISHSRIPFPVLGHTFVSPNAKDSTFALPNARNTNMLVSFALAMNISFFWCIFHSRRVANANPICSGI